MRQYLYQTHDLYRREEGGLPSSEVELVLRLRNMAPWQLLEKNLNATAEDYEDILQAIENTEHKLKTLRDEALRLEHDNGRYYHDLQILANWYRDAGA